MAQRVRMNPRRQARRTTNTKAPGPAGAWLRDRMLPLFLKLGSAAQNRDYSFRLEWS